MAIPHTNPGEPIDVRPLDDKFGTAQTTTLVKTGSLEVIRLVLSAGKEIPGHNVPGEITLQCLEGQVVLHTGGKARELSAGTLVYLNGSEPHALHASEDSSLLLTILLEQGQSR